MLSDAEREALVAIEVTLRLDDPTLANALAHHRPRSRAWIAYDLVTAVAAASGTLCLALSEAGGTEGGVTGVVFATGTFAVRMWRFTPP